MALSNTSQFLTRNNAPVGSPRVVALLSIVLLALEGCGGVSNSDMMEIARRRQLINAQNNQANDQTDTGEAETATDPRVTASAAPPPQQPVQQTTASAEQTSSVSPTPPPTASQSSDPELGQPVDESSRNLSDIAYAINQMRLKKGGRLNRFPSPKSRDDDHGNLSWRVHLLPYLGYQDLYSKFNLELDWDQSPNKELAAEIPEVYQSAGVSGPYTRYLAVVGKGTVIGEGVITKLVVEGNGLKNTVIVVEADSPTAAIWTQPHDLDGTNPGALRKIGKLRGGYAYAAWADGTIAALDMSKSRRLLNAVFDYNGSVAVDRASVTAPFDAEKMAAVAPSERTASVAPDSSPPPATGQGGVAVGFGGPTAPGRASFSPAVSYAGPETANQLANSCLEAAHIARSNGATVDAWNWLYAAVVADLPPSVWAGEMKWVPALRRPSLGVHWAVGVVERSPGTRRSISEPENQGQSASNRHEIISTAAPFGSPFLKIIEDAARVNEPQAIGGGAPGSLPAITYFPKSSSTADLINESSEVGADILVVFNVEQIPGGRSKEVELYFYDVMQRNQIKRLNKAVHSSSYSKDKNEEVMKKARWELGDYLVDHLHPGEWPVRLTEKIALKRVKRLGQMETVFPPRQILEMRYYRSLGLVDDAQMLQSVNSLIGGEQGVNLLLGSDIKKHRVIRQWLPNDDPAAHVATARRRAQAAEDDDD